MRNQVFGVVGAFAIVILPAGTAAASEPHTTKVTISKYSPTWHGKVLSRQFGGVRSCERNRLVKVYMRRDGKDRLVGSDRSNDAGRWVVPDRPADGAYYAVLPERRPGDKPACTGDRSSSQVVG